MTKPEAREIGTSSFVFTAIVLAVVMSVTGISQVSRSFVPGWLQARSSQFQTVWPQQWAFFSSVAGASELTVAALSRTTGHEQDLTIRFMSRANVWGLGRTAASQIVELAELAEQVPTAAWIDCATAPASCAVELRTVSMIDIANVAVDPTVCGSVVLRDVQPSRSFRSSPVRVLRLVVLNVACS